MSADCLEGSTITFLMFPSKRAKEHFQNVIENIAIEMMDQHFVFKCNCKIALYISSRPLRKDRYFYIKGPFVVEPFFQHAVRYVTYKKSLNKVEADHESPCM